MKNKGGRSGTSGNVDVSYREQSTEKPIKPVTDPEGRQLNLNFGVDSNGDPQVLSTDSNGRLDLATNPDVNIGDVQILDSTDAIIDPATEETLSSIESSVATEQTATSIDDAVSNEAGVISGQATDDTTGTTLSSNAVPDGKAVSVKALNSNNGIIEIDGSFELEPKASVSLQVDDVSKISFTAQNSGDGVSWIVEN